MVCGVGGLSAVAAGLAVEFVGVFVVGAGVAAFGSGWFGFWFGGWVVWALASRGWCSAGWAGSVGCHGFCVSVACAAQHSPL